MQKKIIALAVAALASAGAYAQSNVTVYGVADAAYVYTNTNGGTTLNAGEAHGRDTQLIQSGQLAGSRIGFKGTEDLGNGLKALFVLEYSIELDNNNGIGNNASGLNARQQFVGLGGKLGTLTLGRQYAPGYYTFSFDPLLASPGLSSVDAGQALLGSTIRAASPARWNSSVNYLSPDFGGVTVQAIYSAGEVANEIAQGEGYGVGVNYAGGPVAVKYVYQHKENTPGVVPTGLTAGTTGVADEHYVGVTFDAKVVKVLASVQTVDRGNREYAGAASKGEEYAIGAIVPVGRGNIHVSYAQANRDSAGQNAYRGDLTSTSVAYTYGLSKRTTLYTGYRYTDTDVRNAGSVLNVFAAGINHTF